MASTMAMEAAMEEASPLVTEPPAPKGAVPVKLAKKVVLGLVAMVILGFVVLGKEGFQKAVEPVTEMVGLQLNAEAKEKETKEKEDDDKEEKEPPPVWTDLILYKRLEAAGGAVNSVSWSPDGRLAASSDDNTVYVYSQDFKTHKDLKKDLREMSQSPKSVAWSNGGRLAVGTELDHVYVLNPDLTLQHTLSNVWEATSVAWDPTINDRLAVGSDSNLVYVYPKDMDPLYEKSLHDSHWWVLSVAWSLGGKLASGSADKSVYVYNQERVQDLSLMATLKDATDSVMSVAWSPVWSVEGQFAVGSADTKVYVYNDPMMQPEILHDATDRVMSVAWSADGRLAVGSADTMVYVYDQDLILQQTLFGGTKGVSSVAWSSDGLLAVGSKDTTVYVYH